MKEEKEFTLLEDLISNMLTDYEEEVYDFEGIVTELAEICRKFKKEELYDRLNRHILD